ncbi:MAG: response regulator [Eubacteriales bacterium]
MYKVFLVDDEYRIKERLQNLTDWESTPFVFCGEASDGEMALSQINELRPDIVITDIQMPFMDGLELSTILRSTMPWIQIIIISGYDEFEYAKSALKIGVTDYLLKPIKFEELNRVLEKAINKINSEKEQSRKLLQMENRLSSIKTLQRDFLFETLIGGRFDTREIIEQYREYSVDLISKHYIVMDVKIRCESGIDYIEIKTFCRMALEKITNSLLYYRTSDRMIVVLRNNDEQELIEQAFQLSGTIKDGLKKIDGHKSIIGIGNTVNRLSDICKSYKNANKARSYINDMNLDQILYIEDVEKKFSEEAFLTEKNSLDELPHLEVENVDRFLFDIFNDAKHEDRMYRYHIIYTIVFQCNHIVSSLGGRAKDILPDISERDIVKMVGLEKEKLTEVLKKALVRTIEYRRENSISKYSEVIWRAKNYIFDHYSDSGLTLNEVAQHVCLSPNHFSMVFSNETQTTFIEFLTKTRIENAKKLLRDTDLKLSVISNHVGYNEPQYFSYIFKKHTKQTPSGFREMSNL